MIVWKLAEQMGKHKMIQKTVSEKTGIRPNTISAMWHGTAKRFELWQLNALCELFNCQIGDLIEYKSEHKEESASSE